MVYSVFGDKIEVARLIHKKMGDDGIMQICVEQFERVNCPEDINLNGSDSLILRSSDHPHAVMNYFGPIVGIHLKKVNGNIKNIIFNAEGSTNLGESDIVEATLGDFTITNKTSLVDMRLEKLGYRSPRKVLPVVTGPKKKVVVKVRKPAFKNTEERIKTICKKYHVVKVTASTM